MPNGYSRSPRLLKGALIEFSERLIGPVPNVIVFQYNPESMTRTLEVWNQGDTSGTGSTSSNEVSHTAQPFDPPETFTLALELDAADDLEQPDSHPVAAVSGVADRIAAMEMLLYPQTDSLLGGLVSGIAGALSSTAPTGVQPVPRGTVPVVLFVWGPGRILPVRLTSFTVEEQAYSPQLYPIRAKVSIGLKVLIPTDFSSCTKTASQELAITAFNFTKKQKQILAAANTANSVDSILSMLPF